MYGSGQMKMKTKELLFEKKVVPIFDDFFHLKVQKFILSLQNIPKISMIYLKCPLSSNK